MVPPALARRDRTAGSPRRGRVRHDDARPEGEVEPQRGIYLAWEPGRRFATTDAVTGDLMPAGPFMIGIWEIAPEGDGTRYTARARHWREEDRKLHEDMGFAEGWGICADQLVRICEAESC